MSKTWNLGRLFLTTTSQPAHAPRVDLGTTRELEHPFRVGDCKVFRLGREFSLVIGWWRK